MHAHLISLGYVCRDCQISLSLSFSSILHPPPRQPVLSLALSSPPVSPASADGVPGWKETGNSLAEIAAADRRGSACGMAAAPRNTASPIPAAHRPLSFPVNRDHRTSSSRSLGQPPDPLSARSRYRTSCPDQTSPPREKIPPCEAEPDRIKPSYSPLTISNSVDSDASLPRGKPPRFCLPTRVFFVSFVLKRNGENAIRSIYRYENFLGYPRSKF